MRLRLALLMLVNAAVLVSLSATAAEPVSLFDGRTLDGWNAIACEAVEIGRAHV